jgi:hypothetical protein
MAEWSMAVVLKTTVPGRVPGVRIPLPPSRKTSPVLPLRVRRALIDELREPIERWAFGRELHSRAGSWRKQIARDQAAYLTYLNALRDAVKAGGLSRRWLLHLDRLNISLG